MIKLRNNKYKNNYYTFEIMTILSILKKVFLLLTLIKSFYSSLCNEITVNDYIDIKINSFEKLEVGPHKEYCFKYKLSNIKNKISLSFLNGYSRTGEVLIYNSYDNIKKDKSNYINYNIKYNIGNEPYKEFDISDFNDYVYIIIRDSKKYYIFDYLILYDSDVNIPLEEGKPLTIKKFMSNNQYSLTFSSSKDITLVYTPTIKGKKAVSIYINDIFDKTISDENSIYIKYESNLLNKDYTIIIKNEDNNKNDNQEFSIIYYENVDKFKKINQNENIEINYITNQNIQFFYFYIDISHYTNAASVNYKLDYLARNKRFKYINITSAIISSNNEILINDLKYNFSNEFNYEYDTSSDEYLKTYFNANHRKEKYKLFLIKVTIFDSNEYSIPKSFNISIGNEMEEIVIKDHKSLEIQSESYIPTYTKLIFNKESKYLLNIPYHDYILLIKGDLINNEGQLNHDYINNPTDLFDINEISEITIRVYGYKSKITLNIEKYNSDDVVIIDENNRNENVFKFKYDGEQCNKDKEKYIIYKYDINKYSFGMNPMTKYWTTDNEAELNVYYKNNTNFENDTIFPSSKYEIQKEIIFISNNHVDIFAIKCLKPGFFYIRPTKKTFKEKTHVVYQSSISTIQLTSPLEIVQLTSPIKNAPNHIYFSLLLMHGKIKVSPDTPDLFGEKIIDNKTNNLFYLEIDTKKYKMDELAIKLFSDEYSDIEVTETTDCEICQYQNVSDTEKSAEINKNNFIIFIDKNVEKIKLKFNNKDKLKASYGIIRLPTNNIKYIPMAYKFEDEVKEEIFKNSKELNNKYFGKEDQYKPYQAFVFSFKTNITISKTFIEYDIIKKNNNSTIMTIIIITSICISLIIAIIFFIYMCKNKNKRKFLDLDIQDEDKLLSE